VPPQPGGVDESQGNPSIANTQSSGLIPATTHDQVAKLLDPFEVKVLFKLCPHFIRTIDCSSVVAMV